MHRNDLIEAVAEAARDCGLCFHSGYEYRMNEALKEMPALWLSHIEIAKQKGINEGIRTYAVRMFIIDMPQISGATDPEALWQRMEEKASSICTSLAQAQCIKNISDVELAAARDSVTNRGEISMAMKMNIHIPYIKPKNR